MTEIEGYWQPRAASLIVRRTVAEREGHADIGPQIVPKEKSDAAANRGQRNAVIQCIAVVPGDASVDKAVKLVAVQILQIQPLIETQFE